MPNEVTPPGATQPVAPAASPTFKYHGAVSGDAMHPQAEPPAPPPAAAPPPPAAVPAATPYTRADSLPEDALLARLNQAREQAAREAEAKTRAKLLAELGIEDPNKFKTEREQREAELKKYREAEEKRKRAEMTEAQRYKSDLERITKERDDLNTRLQRAEESRIDHEQEANVEKCALKYIDPDIYPAARIEFIRHVNELAEKDPKAADEMGPRDIERFFRQLATKRPKWALSAPTTAADASKASEAAKPTPKPVQRQPLTTGASPRAAPPAPARPVATPDTVNGKTFRPNQPNSMTKQERNAALRSQGIKPWS